MYKMLAVIRTVVSYCLAFLIAAICILPCIIIACLPARYRYANRVYTFFSSIFYTGIIRALLMPTKIVYTQTLPGCPVVIVANHQSALDIPLVGYCLGMRPHMWLVLGYYLRYPILGFFIRRMNVPVFQDKSVKAARALAQLFTLAKKYPSDLIIFPEGGRYIDGNIHPFYNGYALIAAKTGRPVVPVYIKNNYKIYPPRSFLLNDYLVEAIVGPAFELQEGECYEDFNKRIYEWFVSSNI